jgi:hypothetical protein
MALRISFKRGQKQSRQAAQYFSGIVHGLVQEIVDGLQEHTYQIPAPQGPSLQLQIWSAHDLQHAELHQVMELLMLLRGEVEALERDPDTAMDLNDLVRGWLMQRMEGNLYVEVAVLDPVSGYPQLPEFSLAIVHGRCAMMSTDRFLFTWLDEDIFGLTLAGHGSYLLEVVPEQDVRTSTLRRAS